ncbi:MAG: 50S ribosomal protein L30 [Clostridia bacterium]
MAITDKKEPLYINGKYVVTSTEPLHNANFQKGECPYTITDKKVRVTLIKSTVACLKGQIATVEALGLHKIRQSKIFNNSEALQGMLFKVRHLVQVDEI